MGDREWGGQLELIPLLNRQRLETARAPNSNNIPVLNTNICSSPEDKQSRFGCLRSQRDSASAVSAPPRAAAVQHCAPRCCAALRQQRSQSATHCVFLFALCHRHPNPHVRCRDHRASLSEAPTSLAGLDVPTCCHNHMQDKLPSTMLRTTDILVTTILIDDQGHSTFLA